MGEQFQYGFLSSPLRAPGPSRSRSAPPACWRSPASSRQILLLLQRLPSWQVRRKASSASAPAAPGQRASLAAAAARPPPPPAPWTGRPAFAPLAKIPDRPEGKKRHRMSCHKNRLTAASQLKTRTDFVQRPAALTTLRNKIKINIIKDFIKYGEKHPIYCKNPL